MTAEYASHTGRLRRRHSRWVSSGTSRKRLLHEMSSSKVAARWQPVSVLGEELPDMGLWTSCPSRTCSQASRPSFFEPPSDRSAGGALRHDRIVRVDSCGVPRSYLCEFKYGRQAASRNGTMKIGW